MITCQNCGTLNEEILQKCKNCEFLIQDRIPNLDLFKTVWMLLEAPIDTYKLIIRSEQKNYVLLLFYSFTSTIIFFQSWYFKLGTEFDNLIYFILFTQLSSIILFLPVGFLFSALIYFTSKIFNKAVTFKNSFAISSWSAFSILFYFIILIPVGLGIEGLTYFVSNTSSSPPNTYLFQILSGIIFLYYFILSVIGLSVLNGKINIIKICYSTLQLSFALSIILYFVSEILQKIF